MGWSCSTAASKVLESWTRACVASTGMSNTWKQGDREFFTELSNREHDDGAITGSIIELGAPSGPDGARPGRKVGTFKISGDGTVRAPAFLKDAAKGWAR